MNMWLKLHELEDDSEIIVNFDNVTYAEHNYEYTIGENDAVIKETRKGACLHFGHEHYVMVKEDLENIDMQLCYGAALKDKLYWDMKYGE